MESLRGKVAIITGSSIGIGAATAVLFASYGCRLTIHGRNKDNLNKVAEKCKLAGLTDDQLLAVTADLYKPDDITRLMEETSAKFGTLNILVNNAAYLAISSFESLTMELLDDTFNLNVRSVVQLTKLALPLLKQTKGCIVNVSAVCSGRAFTPLTAYCMSKASLDMLTSCLSIELGAYGIRVNSVNPGTIKTPLHQQCGLDLGDLDKYLELQGFTHPLESRCGESEEVAQAIAFLASDAASFISGTHLPVDGAKSQTTAWYNEELGYLKQLRGEIKK